jgi:hypothetical protein
MFQRVDFRYLDFAMERVLCPSSIGAPVHRWIRYGMPRLNPHLSDSVFYLYRKNDDGDIDGPYGTGSIVGRPSNTKGRYHLYGIANWHVAIDDGGAPIMRINTQDGKTRYLEYRVSDWQSIPDKDDLAAVDVTNDISFETDKLMFIGEKEFISREVMRHLELGLGDDC